MKQKLGIKIVPQPCFLADQSSTAEHRFIWSYEITIANQSENIVQLLNRYWRITDMTGRIEEVRGPGVIGLQPIIKPQKQFTYTSFCQLITPTGTMEGYYEMQNLDEMHFLIEIPKFILTSPISLTAEYRSKLH